ncbi:unnamed protein product [Echinostoma caproni]|uniref:Ion_trans domain-containing protein n=1 Tax=Echinostoma caproni TaxID=27848 RepID=A0A183AL96_9TREM|nr:unnamed protein product [Echinostoma caproni]
MQLIVSLVVLLVNTIGTLVFVIWYIRLGSGAEGETSPIHEPPPAVGRRISVRNPSCSAKRGSAAQIRDGPALSASSFHNLTDEMAAQGDFRRDSRNSLISTLSPYCRCTSPNRRRQCNRLLVHYGRMCTYPFGGGSAQSTATLSTMASRIQQSHSNSVTDNTDDLVGNCCLDDELEFQHQRHLLLILVLLTTMFFGICLCTWRLVQEPASGVYLVLEFLDGVFNFGQGIVLLVIFGLDADLIILPVRRFLGRHLRRIFGAVLDTTAMGSIVEIADPTALKERCLQFVVFHLTSCCDSISKASSSVGPMHPSDRVFTEEALIKWLEAAGLVQSDREAALFVDLLASDCLIASVDQSLIEATAAACPGQPVPRFLQFTQSAFELHSAEREFTQLIKALLTDVSGFVPLRQRGCEVVIANITQMFCAFVVLLYL